MMPGRNSKKSKNNLEKIKKEMSAKKQKAESQNKPDASTADIEIDDVKQALQIESKVETENGCVPEAMVKTYGTINGFDTKAESDEQDMVEDVPNNKEKISAEDKKIEMVVFRVGEEEFAFALSNVKEIIRVPSMTKVPNAPQYISGLCNLRGELLPIVDSRKLFGMPDKEFSESSRIIVADICGKKVGLVSDKVSEVINVEETEVKEPPASIKGIDGGVINGILILNDGKRVVMILDAEKIIKVGDLDAAANQQSKSVEKITVSETKEDEEEQIVIFNIGMEEYAFNINYVKEILRLPDVMKVPNAVSHIEGLFSIRNQLLAAINMGRLLSMNCKQPDEQSRVIIINNGSFSYGAIVDKVSHVVRVQKKLFKENSRIAHYSSTELVKGIFSLNNGKRLVMMLDPHKLIHLEDVKGVLDVDHEKTVNDKSLYVGEADNNLEHVVVFKLGEEEYGIEINNVQEINRINEITHFPGAPAFIAGMVDLRGDIIPILNLRRLFAVHDSDSSNASKFLVVEFGNKRIGIMIDSASEVLRFSKAYLEEAPEVFKGNDQDSYIDKIAKLNEGKRIILILNLSSLLSFV